MRTVNKVPVQNVRYNKPALDIKTLEIVEYLKAGGVVPPIKIQKSNQGEYRLRNGRHRLTAHKLLGEKEIWATFSE